MSRRENFRNSFGSGSFPLIFAHRGYSSLAPENTLAAFALAKEKGVPGIELDVHLCSSGEIVVIHDDSLKRTAGLDAKVEETPYSVIKNLDAGSWHGGPFKGQKIPLLSEVFELLGKDVYYDLEIKNKKRETGDLEIKLASSVKDFGMTERTIISSFNPFSLKAVRKLIPEIQTAIIYSCDEEVPPILRHGEGRWISGCRILKPDKEKVSKGSIYIHRLFGNYPILPWVVNDPAEALHLIKLGADGIISDNPSPIMEILKADYSKGLRRG